MAEWRGRGRPLGAPGREERKLDANCSDETECLDLKAYTKGKYIIEHFDRSFGSSAIACRLACRRYTPLQACRRAGVGHRLLGVLRHARVQCERLHEGLVGVPLDAGERVVGIPMHDVLAHVLVAVSLVVVVVHAYLVQKLLN